MSGEKDMPLSQPVNFYRVSQAIVPVSSGGIVETDLQVLILPAGIFARVNDTVHVSAGFVVAASVADPVVRFYIGGAVAVNTPTGVPISVTRAVADIQLMRTAADALTIWGTIPGTLAGGPALSGSGYLFCEVISGLDFDAETPIKFTGQAQDPGDTVQQVTMIADLMRAA